MDDQREYTHGGSARTARLPAWLRRPLAHTGRVRAVDGVLQELDLNTVCSSAKCPNRGECFAEGTATFLIMGDVCTRECRFCAVDASRPAPLSLDEPERVAEAAARMGLRHVVITSVTRDDLPDGGAAHFVSTIEAVRRRVPAAAIEVLTSDFGGDERSIDLVAHALPQVFNHNVETVPRLYPRVRPQADYARSLLLLKRVREVEPDLPTKSGLMLGLGETVDEVVSVMDDLRAHGVEMLTLGQYLRPGARHLPVEEFVEPSVFTSLAREAYRRGFTAVASAPFVRSSYHAAQLTDAGRAEG